MSQTELAPCSTLGVLPVRRHAECRRDGHRVADPAVRLERDLLRVRDLLLRVSRSRADALRRAGPEGVLHQPQLAAHFRGPAAIRDPGTAGRVAVRSRGMAMLVAVPFGLGAAVFVSEFCSGKTKETLKIVIELLAAIPSVVWGFIGLMVLGPMI